jgi:hypothetical protein
MLDPIFKAHKKTSDGYGNLSASLALILLTRRSAALIVDARISRWTYGMTPAVCASVSINRF